MWNKINLYLKNKQFASSKETVVFKAQKIIEELFGEEASKQKIKIQFYPPNLFIKTQSSVLKNEILINRDVILKKLEEALDKPLVKKII